MFSSVDAARTTYFASTSTDFLVKRSMYVTPAALFSRFILTNATTVSVRIRACPSSARAAA